MQEKFRPIPGIDVRYVASNLGYIINTQTGRHMKEGLVRGFYSVKVLNTDLEPFSLRVSRGVLLAFRPIVDAKQYTVKHLDNDLLNARLDNLDWEYRYGENHGRAKITDADSKAIREIYASTDLPMRVIGEKFGVAYKTVQGIVSGDLWTHTL